MTSSLPISEKREGRRVRLILQPMNRVLTVPAGTNLLEAIRQAGVGFESVCGGRGECGKCRVILEGEGWQEERGAKRKFLTPRDLEKGYRLACETRITGDLEVTLPVESRIESPQILIPVGLETDQVSPSIELYPVQVTRDEFFPSGEVSLRLAGYSGQRPQIPVDVYESILSSPPGGVILTHAPG
ncbi:MAG TPA: 2Fe-2S iron-sulfur cluster-binding protein, partial [Methanomicrobiales archaeon]|nr:2Fe-2S iron-sulfur cluster-binding protein [Methanomicrobiales archaeon]